MATVILAGLMIDGTGADPVRDPAVVIEGSQITQVGRRDGVSFDTKKDQVIDMGEAVLMPGLIDSHCHIFSIYPVPAKVKAGNPEPEDLIELIANGLKAAKWWLSQGVTTIRDVGMAMNLDLGLRDLIAQGKAEGPRIYGSGRPIAILGRTLSAGKAYEVSSAAEARWAARQQMCAGANIIKLFASAGIGGALGKMIGESGWEQLTEEEMQAATFEGHKAGLTVSCHAICPQSIKNAVQAGVDSIEHGTYAEEEGIEMMRAEDVVLVPTMAIGEQLAERGTEFGFGPHMEENARIAVEKGKVVLQMAREAGVRIAVGTDPVRQDTMASECDCMHRAGLTPMEVIVAATRTGAELLGVHEHLGSLEAGKTADLIALESNPLDDLAALERVNWVVKDGEVVRNPKT